MSNSRIRCAIVVSALLVGVTCHAGTPAFSNQTVASGIDSAHQPMHPHPMYGGGAVGDFDRDGWIDIFHAVGGGTPDHLFINNRDGTFREEAAAWGVAHCHRSVGAAVGDYDGDGYLDIYVTSLGPIEGDAPGHHRLYRNNGDRTFTEVAAAAGVAWTSLATAEAQGASWGDYDLDGDLDLAVAGYGTAGGGQPEGSRDGNQVFRNEGDGTFTRVTSEAGLGTLVDINGFAPRFVDTDGDRYPELIWIGDFRTSRFYRNNTDGTFTDITEASNTSLGGTEMGVTFADFNDDGRFDFYVTTVFDNKLYMNLDGLTFLERAQQAGVVNTGFGWATVAIDFDHDARVDIVATSQSLRQYAFRSLSPPGGQASFEEVAMEIGLTTPCNGRGLSGLDYDDDGDQDLVFFPFDAGMELHRNDLSGSNVGWLRVLLDRGNRRDIAPDGIGAAVRSRVGTHRQSKVIEAGSNYLSQSEISGHFGLGGAATVDELTVEWPNGEVTVLTNVPASHTIVVWPGGKPGDVDLNGIVDAVDLGNLLTAWGPCPGGEPCTADFDGNEVVGFGDLITLLTHWD